MTEPKELTPSFGSWRRPRNQWVTRVVIPLAAMPLAGGAGLLMYVLAGFSLPISILALFGMAASMSALVMKNCPSGIRSQIARRFVIGATAGALATAAYDATREALTLLTGFSYQPFHAIPVFGELIVGGGQTYLVRLLAGVTYHLFNGVGFGIAFSLLFRSPRIVFGIAWGLFLEAFMATLYPQFLKIAAYNEFLTVSVIGHVVYGAVLAVAIKKIGVNVDLRRGGEGP